MGQIAKAVSSVVESRPYQTDRQAETWGRRLRRLAHFAILVGVMIFLIVPFSAAHADPELLGGDYNCQPEQYFDRDQQACIQGWRPNPAAGAGQDQTVQSGSVVTLNGVASNTLGETTSYSWALQSTDGTLPTGFIHDLLDSLSSGSSTPSFTVPTLEPGDPDLVVTLELTVNVTGYGSEEDFLSGYDTVQITVKSPSTLTAPLLSQTLALTATPDSIPFQGISGISASGKLGTGAVTFAVPDGNGVCTISGSTVTGIRVGICTVTATVDADATYAAASATVDIHVNQVEQSIAVVASPATIIYGEQTNLSTSGGSGSGAVTYEVTDGSSNCSLNGTKVTGTGLGACTITATKAADANYALAAATVQIVVAAPLLKSKQEIASVTLTADTAASAFMPVSASGGFGTKSFAVAPALPTVITLNAATGVITGTPTVAAMAADYSVTVTDHTTPNVQSSSQSFNLKVMAAPATISSVSPMSGATVGGDTVTISGANFNGATALSIGGIAATTFNVNSDTLISATTAGHAAGVVGVVVTTPAGTVTVAHAYTYLLTAQSINFTSVPPSTATVGGSSYVVGASAGSSLSVTFTSGDISICTVTGTTVSFVGTGTCLINANQAGDGIYGAAPQAQQSFTVKAAPPLPTITQISPDVGVVWGTDVVTISGANLSGGIVTFGGVAATPVEHGGSPTAIQVKTPTGSVGAVDVVVTTLAGVATEINGFIYKNGQSITFNSVAPVKAVVGGSTYEFAAEASSGLAISLSSGSPDVCAIAGTTVSFIEEGICRINANQSGSQIYVAAPQKQQSFLVEAAPILITPSITSISPSEGETLGGQSVTIQGAHLDSVLSVKFDGEAAAINHAFSSATQIKITTPSHMAGLVSVVVATQNGEITTGFTYLKAKQTIAFGTMVDAAMSETPIDLTAAASSGLAVSYVSSTTNVCTVGSGAGGKSVVNFLTTGTCSVTASQVGDGYYNAADAVSRTFKIVPVPRQTINTKPVVSAGEDLIVYSDEAVSFQASAIDGDDDPMTYQWEQVGTPVGRLSGATLLEAGYVAPQLEPGSDNLVLTFKVTVSDGKDSVSDTVIVTVKPRANSGTGSLTVAGAPADIVTIGMVKLTFQYTPMTDHSSLGSLTMFGAVSPLVDLLQLATANNSGVTFYDGTVVLCADVALVNNMAYCNVNLATGSHNLRAVYNNGEVSVEPVSDTLIITAVDKAGPNAKAIGGFLSDRANLIVTNLSGMDRQIERLNAAQGAKGDLDTSSNLAESGKSDMLLPEKGDLVLNTSRLGSGPSGASISASRFGLSSDGALGPTNVGGQDMLGFQSFLYNYLRSSGESGNFGRFNVSGPLDMQANFGSGNAQASFKTSLSQIMDWQHQRDQKEMATLGFAQSGGSKYFLPLDIWMEGVYASYSGSRSGAFGMATIGADYVFNPGFLAGFYGQFDATNQTTATAIDGKGWMIGPYATARLGENIFWQGRAGWGKSANAISPDGSYTDRFGTSRWLVSSSLSGKWRFGGGFAFAPSASVTYFEDKSDGYVDHFGTDIPGVKTNLGQLKLSPELSYGFLSDSGLWIEPSLATELIWNFASTNVDGLGTLDGDATGPAGLRGRVKAGFNIRMPSGVTISASGTYDGIGSDSYSAISGLATVSMPLN
jgi:hypothetical protein